MQVQLGEPLTRLGKGMEVGRVRDMGQRPLEVLGISFAVGGAAARKRWPSSVNLTAMLAHPFSRGEFGGHSPNVRGCAVCVSLSVSLSFFVPHVSDPYKFCAVTVAY
jgi:hypothetical protein